MIQYLKTEKQIYPISYSPTSSKVERANSAALYISTGQVLLPKEAIWLDNFKSEINAFPNGKHDDQVDALTQLILKTCGEQQKCSLETLAEAIKRNRVKHIKNVKFPTNMTKSEFCNLVQNSAKTKWIRNNKRFF